MTQWLDYDLTDSPAQQTGEKKKKKCKKHELVSAIEIGIGWMIIYPILHIISCETQNVLFNYNRTFLGCYHAAI